MDHTTTRNIFSRLLLGLSVLLIVSAISQPAVAADKQKHRILVVSSYHRDYLWTHDTQHGLVAAMLHYGYLDDPRQGEDFSATDQVESSKVVLKKLWMDSKRRDSVADMARATERILAQIDRFKPDLVLLGDDNAVKYIGSQLLDTAIPVVFWGVNGLPLKYGLIDSMDHPGHNITGVWQRGYYQDALQLLHKLVPGAKTFAILACDSVTSRAHIKRIQAQARDGLLPLQLIDTVSTNSLVEFKLRARALSELADAFFILNHDTLHDEHGKPVAMLDVGRWYLQHIQRPEATHQSQFVREGMLLAADDSGYKQAYLAFEMVYDILELGMTPGHIRTRTPKRGALMVNRRRAGALGIDLKAHAADIDVVIDESLALEHAD